MIGMNPFFTLYLAFQFREIVPIQESTHRPLPKKLEKLNFKHLGRKDSTTKMAERWLAAKFFLFLGPTYWKERQSPYKVVL